MSSAPLVVTEWPAGLAFWSAVGAWLGLESWLALREHAGRPAGAVQAASPWLAGRTALPQPRALAWSGIAVTAAGAGLRAWSVGSLGRFFRLSVTRHADHELVRRGPYRVLRHPSYAGATLVALGCGLAAGNAVAVTAAVTLPVGAYAVRIGVEERALVAALGDAYRLYAARTARLVPGIW